jgi:luciferase family oxidoreductase group 1
MVPLSVLDLAPIPEGSDAAEALRRSLDLAQHAEVWGYHRFWLAEHHGMPGIASAATSVVIGHIAGGTSSIRVGAGGIMLPNHSPLVIAEQFGTLASLFPGRIDLGLGRAPGTDQLTLRALRRDHSAADSFPHDVAELMHYFQPVQPGQKVQAIPGAGLQVPIWILGSSLYGAQLAAAMGLPFAFASHFAPALMDQALDLYRSGFRPSDQLEHSYAMLGVNVFAAEEEEEAQTLFSSLQQAFINLRLGRPGKLPPPQRGYVDGLGTLERSILEQTLSSAVVGAEETVARGLKAFVERTGADELMLTSQIYDHRARLRSFEIVARGIEKKRGSEKRGVPQDAPSLLVQDL